MKRRDVRDWVVKAEEDYEVTCSLIRKRTPPLSNAICFHAQQCVEKYLKAFLVLHRIAFPKTHALLDLLKLASPRDATLELLRPYVVYLSPYAVNFRYPARRPRVRRPVGPSSLCVGCASACGRPWG